MWQRLRDLSAGEGVPDSPEFGAALRELSELIGWDRERVLAGLGLLEEGLTPERALDEALPEDRP